MSGKTENRKPPRTTTGMKKSHATLGFAIPRRAASVGTDSQTCLQHPNYRRTPPPKSILERYGKEKLASIIFFSLEKLRGYKSQKLEARDTALQIQALVNIYSTVRSERWRWNLSSGQSKSAISKSTWHKYTWPNEPSNSTRFQPSPLYCTSANNWVATAKIPSKTDYKIMEKSQIYAGFDFMFLRHCNRRNVY